MAEDDLAESLCEARTAVRSQCYVYAEIEIISFAGNAFCHSVQSLLSSHLLRI
jgi:hypothetical protein